MVYYDDLYGGVLEGDGNNGSGGIEDLVGGNGISIMGGTVTALVAAVGYRMELNGGTASVARYMPIESVSGSSVTMLAGHAYKIYATSAAITLNTEAIPENSFGLEGHIELFVAGTGYVVAGTNVVLANALEPDAVNNCTVRFHDGLAIISVEDHVAGYIVVNGSTSGEGSLAYGIATSTNDYVAFDAGLNGQTIPLAGAVAEGEKHIVGNSYADTILTGAIDCSTSKITVANLSLQNVSVNGGTMTLGDAFIPSGSTVAVSGGGLAIEKVTGAGSESVIDLGGTYVNVSSGVTASGCTFIGGNAGGYAGVFYVYKGAHLDLNGCELRGDTGGKGQVYTLDVINMTNTVASATTGAQADVYVNSSGGIANFNGGCAIGYCRVDNGGTAVFSGSNTINRIGPYNTNAGRSGFVTISSGASINLTSSIAPGGGITVLTGGCTVNGNFISAGTYTSINSNGQPT